MDPDVRAGVPLGSAATTLVLASIMLDPAPGGNMLDGSLSMWLQSVAAAGSVVVAAVLSRSRADVRAVGRQYAGALIGAAGGLFLLAPVALWFGGFLLVFAGVGLLWATVGLGIGHAIGALLPRRPHAFPAMPERLRWPLAALSAAVVVVAIWRGPGAMLASPMAFIIAWAWGTTHPSRPAVAGATIGALGSIGLVASLIRHEVSFDPQRGGLDAVLSVVALLLATALSAWMASRVCRLASGDPGPERLLVQDPPGQADA